MYRMRKKAMTTPNKNQIIEKAVELWHEDRAKNGDPSFDIEPELEELREEGFLSVAQSELMRGSYRAEIEGQFIDFVEPFKVDLDELYESNGLILGSRHTGKSDVAMLISERAMKEGTIVSVFDPSTDWISRSCIAQYMKVESYTILDVPNESTIYDISLLSPLQQQKIVEDFSKLLFERQAKAVDRKQHLVVFEEAQTYFPQGCMRAKRFQNVVRLLSVGRNIDIACLLISQFPAMLDKFAVKHTISQCWFGFTKEPNDLQYLKRILGDTSEELTKLNDGEFLYLDRKGIEKIGIEPYESSIAKTQIRPSIAVIPEPIQPKPKHTDNGKALGSILLLLLWLLILYVALR